MRLLVFSKTTGFRHDSIPAGIAAVARLGDEHGFAVDATEDAADFTRANLARYAAVVFMSSSGVVFDDAQRTAFREYVESGGGFVGVHAASTTERGWDWFGELVGTWFTRHPHVQPAVIGVEDRDHPSTAHLGGTWERVDEWYEFEANPRGRVRVLLTVDEGGYEGAAFGADHPIAWCREVGEGRSFYTALGHTEESFAEPAFLAHLLGGIRSVTSPRAG
ncbi:Crp/Fnr family transcriptional regulator [Actinorhabdospora filicis]|uniref:Crp/Fnr family transcriptional regulator n=1 Tax=Actinorhabdospora filicis TaxID=1785913 RepID=A0A9W6SKC6_9ACTN|nr:ThuA domain-containing protein [Actinorhabdospora filicis]GLZ76196.1 Crp/Fnr family transcriptional regulator [Actinorhabdospora filicis]